MAPMVHWPEVMVTYEYRCAIPSYDIEIIPACLACPSFIVFGIHCAKLSKSQMLPQFFDIQLDDRSIEVKEGDTLSLGTHTIAAPCIIQSDIIVQVFV